MGMLNGGLFRSAALAASLAFVAFGFASDVALARTPKPTIVLVHGAWADASSWNAVVADLQKAGFTVAAPPNMLRGLTADAALIATYVKTIPGPVVLVGHSYGGSVISVASAGASNVEALVFVDAFVPDAGESCLSLLAGGPPPPPDLFVPITFAASSGGDADLYFNPKYYGAVFSSDQSATVSASMAATQRPVTNGALNEKSPTAEGWKSIPSWYVVGDADKVIPPKLQLFMATRAKAAISHAPGAAHPSMISHPEVTVAAILSAVDATTKQRARRIPSIMSWSAEGRPDAWSRAGYWRMPRRRSRFSKRAALAMMVASKTNTRAFDTVPHFANSRRRGFASVGVFVRSVRGPIRAAYVRCSHRHSNTDRRDRARVLGTPKLHECEGERNL